MINTLAVYVHRLNPYFIGPYAVGPFESLGIRWYGLSYVMGFVAAWLIVKRLAKRGHALIPVDHVSDFVLAVAIGTVLGGRLGYCLFYRIDLFWDFSSEMPWWGVLKINEGGMASHGGIIGIMIACVIYARRHAVTTLHLFDLCTFTGTIGVFFGRIANFINSELLGRPCDPNFPLAVKFPKEITEWPVQIMADHTTSEQAQGLAHRLSELGEAVRTLGPEHLGVTEPQWQQSVSHFAQRQPTQEDIDIVTQVVHKIVEVVNGDTAAGHTITQMIEPVLVARHPSQLYAAGLEGLTLFLVLGWLWRKPRKPGFIAGAFLVGYAVVRVLDEHWRMPDAHIGFQALGLTRGQWLSIGMFAIGVLCMFFWSRADRPLVGGWATPTTAPVAASEDQPADGPDAGDATGSTP
ncbi:MAG: prolipoprotein diacylglyceryl transferase [Phycisphaera sp.]|nr:prolipoprotein diacylglyceryl transferase [Phycisphaera sp.]